MWGNNMEKQLLDKDKAYDLKIFEKGRQIRVAYLGERVAKNGENHYWIYYFDDQRSKEGEIISISLKENSFLTDGSTITPLDDREWFSNASVIELNERSRKCFSDLIGRLKLLGVIN